MKKNLLLLLVTFLHFSTQAQGLAPAPEDKAVIYFIRGSGLGFAINISYFDSTELIGKFNGVNYFRYECDPGKRLIWARSENKDYVEANLLPGKVYILEVEPLMGAIKAGVQLNAIDPSHKRYNRLMKFVQNNEPSTLTPEELEEKDADMQDVIARGMTEYAKRLRKDDYVEQLEDWMFVPLE